MASNPLTSIPLKKSHGFHCHQLSERWQQIWERACIWGSCLALSHWNVFWPWWSNVMWEMDKQVESTPSETSRVESLLLKPTLRILVTWGWCYVRANLKVLVIRFFEVLPRFEIAILITRTNTKRDKPTFWRQLLPRKDDGIRLKSEIYYLGIAKRLLGGWREIRIWMDCLEENFQVHPPIICQLVGSIKPKWRVKIAVCS